jgi:hypothetical protein
MWKMRIMTVTVNMMVMKKWQGGLWVTISVSKMYCV